MIEIVEAVALGFAFGWVLHKGGLTRYATIVNVFRLRDATLLRFLLTALAVAALVAAALSAIGVSNGVPVPATRVVANLVGGIVFGAGMATAGYCPATVVAQAGEGHLDAWTAGLAGLLTGAVVFGLLQPVVMPPLASVGSLGRVTLASWVGASSWLVALVFAELVAVVLLALRR